MNTNTVEGILAFLREECTGVVAAYSREASEQFAQALDSLPNELELSLGATIRELGDYARFYKDLRNPNLALRCDLAQEAFFALAELAQYKKRGDLYFAEQSLYHGVRAAAGNYSAAVAKAEEILRNTATVSPRRLRRQARKQALVSGSKIRAHKPSVYSAE